MRNYTIIIHCSIDSLSLSRSEVCRGEATAFLWPVGIGRNKKKIRREKVDFLTHRTKINAKSKLNLSQN